MKHRIRGVRWLAVTALLVGVVTVPSALAQGPQGQAETLGTGLWFVELTGKPVAAGGSLATNTAEKVAFRARGEVGQGCVHGAPCFRHALERSLDQD